MTTRRSTVASDAPRPRAARRRAPKPAPRKRARPARPATPARRRRPVEHAAKTGRRAGGRPPAQSRAQPRAKPRTQSRAKPRAQPRARPRARPAARPRVRAGARQSPGARGRPPIDERILRRRAAVRRESVRRRRRIAGSVLVLIVVAGLAYVATRSPLFEISAVQVRGAMGEQADSVRSAAAIDAGDNLLLLDADAVRTRVERLPWVREASVGRVPPATVEVRVDVREPAAVVRLPSTLWTVDADGVVLAGGGPDDLVTIAAPHAVLPGVGSRITDPAVRNALLVHERLPGPVRTSVLRYEATSDRDLRFLLDASDLTDDGIWVRFGTAERVDVKARVIGLLLEQAREQARREGAPQVAELDVRTPDNPVLVPVTEP